MIKKLNMNKYYNNMKKILKLIIRVVMIKCYWKNNPNKFLKRLWKLMIFHMKNKLNNNLMKLLKNY